MTMPIANLDGLRVPSVTLLRLLRQQAPKPFDMRPIRMSDLMCLIRHRHGEVLPDADHSRVLLRILCDHLAKLPRDTSKLIPRRIAEMAPWMGEAERAKLAKLSCTRPRLYKAARLGRMIGLTFSERTQLRITTIAAIDTPPKRDRERERWRRRQAEAGRMTRPEYLQQFSTSANLTRPWEDMGISRRTYFYRKKQCNQAPLHRVTPHHNSSTGAEGPSANRLPRCQVETLSSVVCSQAPTSLGGIDPTEGNNWVAVFPSIFTDVGVGRNGVAAITALEAR